MRLTGALAILTAGAQSISTRRLLVFLSGILLLSTFLLVLTSTNLSAQTIDGLKIKHDFKASVVSQLKDKAYGVPKIFGPAAHQPPPPPVSNGTGTGSTSGWFATWSWMNPFSASDDDRVALPPLQRCPIYTYYEPGQDDALEDKMLLAWRRAWWAYGFEPIILGLVEAKLSGFYEVVHRSNAMPELKGMTPELEKDLLAWMAWNYVGGGILVDHRVSQSRAHQSVRFSADLKYR